MKGRIAIVLLMNLMLIACSNMNKSQNGAGLTYQQEVQAENQAENQARLEAGTRY